MYVSKVYSTRGHVILKTNFSIIILKNSSVTTMCVFVTSFESYIVLNHILYSQDILSFRNLFLTLNSDWDANYYVYNYRMHETDAWQRWQLFACISQTWLQRLWPLITRLLSKFVFPGRPVLGKNWAWAKRAWFAWNCIPKFCFKFVCTERGMLKIVWICEAFLVC